MDCDVCASCIVSCIPVIDTCEQTFTTPHLICVSFGTPPKIFSQNAIVCKTQTQIQMASDDRILFGALGNVFWSPIITWFHSGHAKVEVSLLEAPIFLEVSSNKLFCLASLFFNTNCSRILLFLGPKHKKSTSLRLRSLNTCQVRYPKCVDSTRTHTQTCRRIEYDWDQAANRHRLPACMICLCLSLSLCNTSNIHGQWNILQKVWESGAAWRQGSWPGKGKAINFSAE